jgi:serine/threonine-protein kinase RsbW
MTDDTLRIAARVERLAEIRRFVERTAAALGAGQEAIDDLVLAVDEAATNIVVHGYQGQPGMIEVEVGRQGDTLRIHLRDGAPPFDPTLLPMPDVTLPLEMRPLGGLGIFLMRQSVDAMTYRLTAEGGNELTLIKHIGPRPATGAGA